MNYFYAQDKLLQPIWVTLSKSQYSIYKKSSGIPDIYQHLKTCFEYDNQKMSNFIIQDRLKKSLNNNDFLLYLSHSHEMEFV